MAMLRGYAWPGNVRELRNMVESLLLMSEREAVTEEEAAALLEAAPARPEPVAALELESVPGTSLEQAERAAIAQAVRHCHGNLAEAARALRISRSTLYRKMERYDLAL
jgi:DNA-binding NtrC family response regulator